MSIPEKKSVAKNLINKYAKYINYGTAIDYYLPEPPTPNILSPSADTEQLPVDYTQLNKTYSEHNKIKNDEYINQQIRINNLNEIDHSKQIYIYILYIILFISSGCLVLLLK